MKVVIFCGGLGVRMGEETQRIPKPMIRIGNRPILWHIMRYYADWGHKDFVLCLGYKGDLIKEYFLTHNEALTNDFVLEGQGPQARIELLSRTTDDWRITFVDTGLTATIGGRLKAIERFIGDDSAFLATYGDGLTDAPLPDVIEAFHDRRRTALFLSVKPRFNAHLVATDEEGTVTRVEDMASSDVRINGGFFVFKREIFEWIEPGDELVEETFARLIPQGEVVAYRYDGFFGPMDTIKDRQHLEALHDSGNAPWIVPTEIPSSAPASR
jgi:glucose-1-phosphate cytidylyltransferase